MKNTYILTKAYSTIESLEVNFAVLELKSDVISKLKDTSDVMEEIITKYNLETEYSGSLPFESICFTYHKATFICVAEVPDNASDELRQYIENCLDACEDETYVEVTEAEAETLIKMSDYDFYSDRILLTERSFVVEGRDAHICLESECIPLNAL